jgi:hypothetical protein
MRDSTQSWHYPFLYLSKLPFIPQALRIENWEWDDERVLRKILWREEV